MSLRLINAEQEQQQRELRVRIARLRRRIDGRLHGLGRDARRLTSWRTYVRTYPGSAVAAALGLGLALSAGLSAGRLSRWLGMRIFRRALDHLLGSLWRDVLRIWGESAPNSQANDSAGKP